MDTGKTIVLELNQRDGIPLNTGQAEWKIKLPEPIMIEEGDVVQLQQIMINSNNSSANNLNLEEDTPISITVGFYMTCFNQDVGTKYKQNEYLQFMTCGNSGGVSYKAPTKMKTKDTSNYTDLQKGSPESVKYYVLRNNNYDDIDDDFQRFVEKDLYTQTFTYTLPAGSYSPDQIAQILTDKMSESDAFIYFPLYYRNAPPAGVTDVDINEHLFSLDLQTKYPLVPAHPTGTQYPDQCVQAYNHDAKMMLGANQTQLSYDGNAYKLNFLHTPMYRVDTVPPEEIIVMSKTVDSSKNIHRTFYQQQSGCFITSLQPTSFWDQLGFTDEYNQKNIYPVNSAGISLNETNSVFTAQEFQRFITAGFVGNVNDYDSTQEIFTRNVSTAGKVDLYGQSATVPLQSGGSYKPDDNGYYIVEIESNLSQNYYYDVSGRRTSVMANVSKAYDNNDWITGYTESTIPYQHNGGSQMLSELTVKIYEPDDREQSAKGLGDNSVIFLRIDKA